MRPDASPLQSMEISHCILHPKLTWNIYLFSKQIWSAKKELMLKERYKVWVWSQCMEPFLLCWVISERCFSFHSHPQHTDVSPWHWRCSFIFTYHAGRGNHALKMYSANYTAKAASNQKNRIPVVVAILKSLSHSQSLAATIQTILATI